MLLSTVTINYIVKTTHLFKIVATTNHILIAFQITLGGITTCRIGRNPEQRNIFRKNLRLR